ncbi:MAG: cobalt transporter, partial [Firmicutes bacterium]|nr:cobalt transporter [Bacillota bacterium]
EERLALLKYMVQHNAHHAEELHDLAHGCEGESADLLHQAVTDIEESNKKIEAALKLLEG